ncbi:MAG TPA: SusC/RagA family TonB-linked outer membrane protein [Longimicrobium sp.]|nr:SusC/RagA family TonB-linked outer membrane protein [Longimicrobium sp.]
MRQLRRLLATLVAVASVPTLLAAQENATVSGRVTNASGGPESAVLVRIESLNVGASTSADGTYRLVIPGSRLTGVRPYTITASRQGIATVSHSVSLGAGSQVAQNFTVSSQAVALQGVVVTALGITRSQRSLGYSAQGVTSAELNRVPEQNVVNTLSGKVAGVVVTNAGPQGGSSRIVIRGATSISGNNQPLFVVDGVPIDNTSDRNTGYGGIDYGNTASDINPNDIEAVTVLKGPNAAALYGARAANGAVIITTKSGRRATGLGLTVSQSVSSESPLRLPSYQNQYAQGYNGRFDYVNGRGGGRADGVDESWGPKMGTLARQFNSNGDSVPLQAFPNNVADYFETGRTLITSVSLATSNDRANVRLAGTNWSQDGITPTTEFGRKTLSLNGGLDLTSRLTANAGAQYIHNTAENRPGTGYDDYNPMMGFVWFGRQVDVNYLRENYKDENGNMISWNYNYHPNPFYNVFESRNADRRDRVIGHVQTSYEFTDWLKLMGRVGTDYYTAEREFNIAPGSFGFYVGRLADAPGENGAFEHNVFTNQETNADFLFTADKYLTENFSVVTNFGGNRRWDRFTDNYAWVRSLGTPGTYNLANSLETPYVTNELIRRQVNSLYGDVQFGYHDYLFLNLTGRNDWSSTLPKGNNSYFYPSISGSFVFTDALNLSGSVLSSGKVRAGWTRVGNDAPAYSLITTYLPQQQFNAHPSFTLSNTLNNANLKPESTTSWEIGTELGFFDGRVNLDVAYYNKTTRDEILATPVSPASGYTRQYLNAGAIGNKGVEVQARFVPIQKTNFQWDMTVNFGKNQSRVLDLNGDTRTLVLGSYWGVNIEARKGEPYGALFGTDYLRVDDSASPFFGQLIVGEDGLPIADPVRRVLGNYQPDWVGGINNHFRYRNMELSFLLDTHQGGQLFSTSNMWGKYTGVFETTLRGREVDWNNPGLVVQGVQVDANGAYVPNTTNVLAQNYNESLYYINAAHVYDASFWKLRELSLAYTMPQSTTRRLGVSGLTVAAIGRNLWLSSKVPNIDPETAFDASNVQGIEGQQLPTPRSIGFTVSLTP